MTLHEPPALLFGQEAGDHLRLSAVAGDGPEAPGWLDVQLEVRAGAFSARLAGALEREGLAAFRAALADLAAAPRGRAALVVPDGFLAVRLLGDGFGHFDARFELRDLAAIGTRLELTLPVEGQDLPALLAGLDALLADGAQG